VLNGAWSTFEAPYHGVEASGSASSPALSVRAASAASRFSDSIRLGRLRTSGTAWYDRRRRARAFLARVTYDFYTGAGWRTTDERQG